MAFVHSGFGLLTFRADRRSIGQVIQKAAQSAAFQPSAPAPAPAPTYIQPSTPPPPTTTVQPPAPAPVSAPVQSVVTQPTAPVTYAPSAPSPQPVYYTTSIQPETAVPMVDTTPAPTVSQAGFGGLPFNPLWILGILIGIGLLTLGRRR